MPLVIVESPAKCQKIKSFLGADYDVIASMGHIRALEESIDAVGIDRDFEPRFEFMKDKSKTINQLKESAKKHSLIILAADDDREGEAIAYSIALLLKQNPATAVRAVSARSASLRAVHWGSASLITLSPPLSRCSVPAFDGSGLG